MEELKIPESTVITIFGGSGDLTWRKLMPALYNLKLDGWMPEKFTILGLGRNEMTDDEFRNKLKEGISQFSRSGKPDEEVWSEFSKNIHYITGDFTDEKLYSRIGKECDKYEKEWSSKVTRVFYLAIPPVLIETVAEKISKAKLATNKNLSRIVIEKPFGSDLESAKKLNENIGSLFSECQIYRIDHYLGKETVQNILVFRFANALFEPIWNRNYIDHVQVTVAEKIGVEDRGGYYETAGALRDMIQNHLLQLTCLIAMEPPVSFNADEVRNRTVDVLHAIRKISRQEVHNYAVRGQYDEGWIEGTKVQDYRSEVGVSKDSSVETFAACKFFIDNWRWKDVPFYLRTGKRMQDQISVITIQFKPVPHQTFPETAVENWQPNKLILNIQPDMGIRIRFQAKQPGLEMYLNPVDMLFDYSSNYTKGTPEAYETLLLDIIKGDATLFMRADQIEAAWEVVQPILEKWTSNPSVTFPNYKAGSEGPEDAEVLIARDGKSWVALPFKK